MSYEKIDDLPSEITEKLPQGGQQVFMTAFNSASSDGLSDEAAQEVAWNTIKQSYEKGQDGEVAA